MSGDDLQIQPIAVRDFRRVLQQQEAVLMPAERGSVLTLLHPEFAVVVPEPDPIKVPLAYALSRHDDRWLAFIDLWIELKRRDGTLDKLYRHWILGQDALKPGPRWSVLRNVFGVG